MHLSSIVILQHICSAAEVIRNPSAFPHIFMHAPEVEPGGAASVVPIALTASTTPTARTFHDDSEQEQQQQPHQEQEQEQLHEHQRQQQTSQDLTSVARELWACEMSRLDDLMEFVPNQQTLGGIRRELLTARTAMTSAEPGDMHTSADLESYKLRVSSIRAPLWEERMQVHVMLLRFDAEMKR